MAVGGASGYNHDVNRTVALLSQHQLSSLVATAVDYAVMIVCVSVIGLSPVMGTVAGALCGAVTSFTLGRRWVFDARKGDLRGQALRYAMVSTVSLCCNAGGEWLLVRVGLQYVIARVVASTVVGIGWNFPMHRHFVFRADRDKPAVAGSATPSEAPPQG
ncbi:MAG: CDP-diacylglycerol--glycerol-3-phosphate 3-phosphatidyltransferase [bacterium]|nr:CDP-diacylglycerol--glycerol-3-phosphate 3-phosphatidyltransferase [bacterium]